MAKPSAAASPSIGHPQPATPDEPVPAIDLSASPQDDAPAPEGAWGAQDDLVNKVERAFGGGPAGKSAQEISPKARALLVRALKAFKKREFGVTALKALDAVRLEPKCAQAWHVLALGLENLGQLYKALAMYERALALDPNDSDIYLNLGLVAWRLKMVEGAEKFFRVCIQLSPESPIGYNNLGGALRDLHRYNEAVDVLRQAIHLFPNASELWNTLGTVAMEQNLIDEAKLFYAEALRLNPRYARAHHNIAHTLAHTGELHDSLDHYDTALKLSGSHPDLLEIHHGRALALLALGRLDEGWKEWEVRHDARFRGSMLIGTRTPRWQGEPLEGKRLLIMGEQGLGDELMFATGYRELISQIGSEGKLVVSCDYRLIPLFERSFPGAEFHTYTNTQHNGKLLRLMPWADGVPPFDYFSPNGSTLRFLRTTLDQFPKDTPLFEPDPERVAYWRAKLAELGDGPKVGVCWRSMVMTGARAKYYSPLAGWGPILNVPSATFINLQYGDSAADRAFAEETFRVPIHNFDELDLKNALDDNAALCRALDLVISAPTAAGALAGSVGTKVWLLCVGYVWPMLGTPDRFPWFIDNTVFMPDVYADWPDVMRKVGAALETFQPARLQGVSP